MKANRTFIHCISVICIVVFFILPMSLGEQSVWDCPECGRIGNTGNYCGGCGHPAPWLEPAPSASPSFSAPSLHYKVGNTVEFGRYPQSNHGGIKPIQWIVLELKDDQALLLSKYGLDAQPYNETDGNADTTEESDWESCTLRSWLNHDFLTEAFDERQQNLIIEHEIDNSEAQGYPDTDAKACGNTEDRIFLLSYFEVFKKGDYFHSDEDRKAVPTEYALEQGAEPDDNGNCFWWLRTPGTDQWNAAAVQRDGTEHTANVNEKICIRPALWVQLTD